MIIVALLAVAVPPPTLSPPNPMPARLLRTLARNPDGYDRERSPIMRELVLGDLLFHSPAILGAKARKLGVSCNTCHPNGGARPESLDLTSDMFAEHADDRVDNPVNIPSLRGARYTAPYGRDGRARSIAEMIDRVVRVEFEGAPLAPEELSALARYVEELDFLPNRKLDARMRVTAAPPGEAIFRKSCASCHIPSAFFRDGLAHRHLSARQASPYSLDDALETPTLLGTQESAPYFHDGRFADLESVVAWYDASFELGLDERDRRELVEYLRAIGAVDEPYDRRPLPRRLAEQIAYLTLLEEPTSKPICELAVDAVVRALEEQTAPAGMQSRLIGAKRKLAKLATYCEPNEVRPLEEELLRIAADWSGALTR